MAVTLSRRRVVSAREQADDVLGGVFREREDMERPEPRERAEQ